MKASVTLSNLREGLQSVSPALPRAATLPVLQHIHVEAGEDGLTLTSTDLDRWIRAHVDADVEAVGEILVPGAELIELVGKLRGALVSLAHDGHRLKVSAGSSTFDLGTIDVGEWPDRPSQSEVVEWTMSGRALRACGSRLPFCTSREQSRPLLQGVHWNLEGGRMEVVATDGHKLTLMGFSSNGTEAKALLPPEAVKDVGQLFRDEEEVRVVRYGGWIGFSAGKIAYLARLKEGQYVAYHQVIPKGHELVAVADRAALIHAIELAAVVADENTGRIRLEFSADQVLVSGASEVGEGAEPLEIEYDGEPKRVAINNAYLRGLLSRLPGERVRIEMDKREGRALVMRPEWGEDEPPEDGNVLMLCMPLRDFD